MLYFSCSDGCVGWYLCCRLWAWDGLPLNTYISMYARTNRCYNERGSWTSCVRSSIPNFTVLYGGAYSLFGHSFGLLQRLYRRSWSLAAGVDGRRWLMLWSLRTWWKLFNVCILYQIMHSRWMKLMETVLSGVMYLKAALRDRLCCVHTQGTCDHQWIAAIIAWHGDVRRSVGQNAPWRASI